MSMSHPEHEDPAMRDHDDAAAEMAAIRLGFEAAESALADAADAVGSALIDLTAVDAGFELVPEMTQCVRVLAMVQARVAERLAYLSGCSGYAEDAPEPPDGPSGLPPGVGRMAAHPSARQRHSEFPHPFDSRLGDALRASGINAADALAVQALYATAGQSGSHRIVSALRAVEAWLREGGAL